MAERRRPTSGTPCWISIAAKDVARAKKFYGSVFDWSFRPDQADSENKPDEWAFFEFKGGPGGAIQKVSQAEHTGNAGKGNVHLFLWVDDLVEYMDKVKAAGGKQVSEIMPESDRGLMQFFEDTEGNYFGMYVAKPQACGVAK